MGAACSNHRRDEKCITIFGRKPEGKRPLGRPRHRWEDIRMDLQVRGCLVSSSKLGVATGKYERGSLYISSVSQN
jgi:hypothetical protein